MSCKKNLIKIKYIFFSTHYVMKSKTYSEYTLRIYSNGDTKSKEHTIVLNHDKEL